MEASCTSLREMILAYTYAARSVALHTAAAAPPNLHWACRSSSCHASSSSVWYCRETEQPSCTAYRHHPVLIMA